MGNQRRFARWRTNAVDGAERHRGKVHHVAADVFKDLQQQADMWADYACDVLDGRSSVGERFGDAVVLLYFWLRTPVKLFRQAAATFGADGAHTRQLSAKNNEAQTGQAPASSD